MVSKQLFAYVNWRLQQIKRNQKPFGGMSVLVVGYFQQLSPPGKAKPLCVYEDHVQDFWKENFQMITLTQIMRQRDDLAYAELLNRLRVKQRHESLADADRCMLESVIRTSSEESPTDALHIYATNKEVDNHNTAAISSCFSDIITSDADDYRKDPCTGQMKRKATPFKGDKGDLNDKLQIVIGARVMLTRNVDVEDGLVNGTFAIPDYLQVDGYRMYKRNRHASYTNYVHLAKMNGGGVAIYLQATQLQPHRVFANLNALLKSLEILDIKPILVFGDFNEDQLSNANKPILSLFQDNKYTQLISTGTTINNTLLDPLFITSSHSHIRAGVLQTYYSYHDPVYCVLE
ncbi:uncharacterized protein LOC101884770 [Tachysurus ichikawai]